MTQKRIVRRSKTTKRIETKDERDQLHNQKNSNRDKVVDLADLQDQVGNRTVQNLIVQRQMTSPDAPMSIEAPKTEGKSSPTEPGPGQDRDNEGRKLHSSGVWNSNTTLSVQGGQGMHFSLKNLNVLGTTIRITDQSGQSDARIILPMGTEDITFAVFGEEPMGWKFDVKTESDAFLVQWQLYSSWVPGDPPNR